MRRPALLLLPVLLAALGLGACATYRQDLERARAHYDKNEYEAALALFRVLEPDTDSFSTAEYARYSYSRGMTDYRLAALANPGSALTDPKASFRANARHWLSVARAVEKETPGGLDADEKQRLDEALVDLNKDVYGGGDAPADTAVKAAAPSKPTPAKDDTSTGGK
jgi:hypothetical protein